MSAGQRLAVLATLKNEEDVIAILATGAGKTMTAVLASRMESNFTTVVVLPLKSLLMDYERRLKEMKIAFRTFHASDRDRWRTDPGANLVLVLVDQARRSEWNEALATIHRSRPVRRIIIDEIHLLLTNKGFRTRLQNLYELRMVPCQFVLLSGTIPPHAITSIKDACKLTPNFVTIRTDTVRMEHQYVVETPSSCDEIEKRTRCLVDLMQKKFGKDDRGLIYVNTKEELTLFQQSLGCLVYCGGDEMTDASRLDNYQRWIEGENWMVCTSAFSAGNDYSHVRCVIFAGTPACYSDFQQASGRAGRDRRHAVIVVLPNMQDKYKFFESSPTGPQGVQALINMVYVKNPSTCQCIRRHTTAFMDGGKGRSCKDVPNGFSCSRCSPVTLDNVFSFNIETVSSYSNELIESGTNTLAPANGSNVFDNAMKHALEEIRKKAESDTSRKANLTTLLSKNHSRCLLCVLCSGEEIPFHELVDCPHYSQDVAAFIKMIHYKQKGICFKCHIPHHGYERSFKDRACDYKDLLPGMTYGLWKTPIHRGALETFTGVHWEGIGDYAKWIAEPVVGYQSNMIRVFHWWCNDYSREVRH